MITRGYLTKPQDQLPGIMAFYINKPTKRKRKAGGVDDEDEEEEDEEEDVVIHGGVVDLTGEGGQAVMMEEVIDVDAEVIDVDAEAEERNVRVKTEQEEPGEGRKGPLTYCCCPLELVVSRMRLMMRDKA